MFALGSRGEMCCITISLKYVGDRVSLLFFHLDSQSLLYCCSAIVA